MKSALDFVEALSNGLSVEEALAALPLTRKSDLVRLQAARRPFGPAS